MPLDDASKAKSAFQICKSYQSRFILLLCFTVQRLMNLLSWWKLTRAERSTKKSQPSKIKKVSLTPLADLWSTNTSSVASCWAVFISFLLYAGSEGISNKLKVDIAKGISGESFPDRTEYFGNNYRPPKLAKTFCKIFFETLDDFMLKVLIVAATLSLICEYIAADSDHYSTGKYLRVIFPRLGVLNSIQGLASTPILRL